LVISLVHTRLDYGCSTLASCLANTISRLQSVLNAVARLVFSSRKTHRVSPPLQRLHWLKMDQRIEYKLALLVTVSMLWHHRTSPTNCNLFQFLTHGDDYDQQPPLLSSFRRLVFLPLVIRLFQLSRLGFGTACKSRLHQQRHSAL